MSRHYSLALAIGATSATAASAIVAVADQSAPLRAAPQGHRRRIPTAGDVAAFHARMAHLYGGYKWWRRR